ncbi:hypothetical protein L2E82_02566 [Cichorium intybus]|uniref:Uncharacterized protein n=1 Tax=Cichorium intybus TaxID=13427 RepID=A0ACB9H453_CICIN|nr:hypothetical protein L2E82_02566 [Cichorium intybus]
MSTSPSLLTTTESKEDADYNKICEEYKHLIKTIPNSKGWSGKTLYNYNCFWLTPTILKRNLLIHTYFKSQLTDIVLASVMKSGTTWLKARMFSTVTILPHPDLHFISISRPNSNSKEKHTLQEHLIISYGKPPANLGA